MQATHKIDNFATFDSTTRWSQSCLFTMKLRPLTTAREGWMLRVGRHAIVSGLSKFKLYCTYQSREVTLLDQIQSLYPTRTWEPRPPSCRPGNHAFLWTKKIGSKDILFDLDMTLYTKRLFFIQCSMGWRAKIPLSYKLEDSSTSTVNKQKELETADSAVTACAGWLTAEETWEN